MQAGAGSRKRGRTLDDKAALRLLTPPSAGTDGWPELSEFEFGLIVSWHAFERWVTRCMRASGLPELSLNDILVLHHVHHRGRAKRLADICFALGYEDTHVVTYALRKLTTAGLVSGHKAGKEVLYRITDDGTEAIERYRQIRDRCLLAGPASAFAEARSADEPDIAEALALMARRLRAASGWYDQAARAASSL